MTKISIDNVEFEKNISIADNMLKSYEKDNLKISKLSFTNLNPFEDMIKLIDKLDHLKNQYQIVLQEDINKFKKSQETYINQDNQIAQGIGSSIYG